MLTILIVDDSLTARMLFKMHMSKAAECKVRDASNLAGALAVLAESQPQLIVVDYNMPVHNGIEVARALTAQGSTAPLVLLTANTQQSTVDEARSAGFVQVVEKPITPEKLSRLIGEVLA